MMSEFLAIIGSDGTHRFLVGFQQVYSGFSNQISLFLFKLSDKGEFRLPLNEAKQCSFVLFPDDGIDLPITDPPSGIDNGRSFIDTDTALYLTSTIMGPVAFSVLFMREAEMAVERTSFGLIVENMLIDTLMTNSKMVHSCQKTGNLFRAEILPNALINTGNHRRCQLDEFDGLSASFKDHGMGLFRSIALFSSVTPQLPGYRGFVNTDFSGNGCF